MTKIQEIFESKLQLCEETDSKYFLGTLRFSFAKGDWKNRNGRIYPSALLKREVEKMKVRLKESPVGGMLEHDPAGLVKLDRISHVITNLEWDEAQKLAFAEAKILQTTKGQDLKVLLHSVPLGASMFGHGEVGKFGRIEDDYALEGIDLVSKPSFGNIAKVSSANLIESGNSMIEKELKESGRAKYFGLMAEAKNAGHPNPKEYAKKILAEIEGRNK